MGIETWGFAVLPEEKILLYSLVASLLTVCDQAAPLSSDLTLAMSICPSSLLMKLSATIACNTSCSSGMMTLFWACIVSF